MVKTGKEKASGFVSAVVNFIKGLPGKIWTWLSNAAQKVVSWGADLASKGREAAAKLFESITGALADLPREMVSIGSNIIKGLWNGISEKFEWLKNKVTGVVSTIKNLFTGVTGFDESSPSKWSKGVAKYVMDGLGNGFDAGLPDTLKTARKATDRIKGTISGISSDTSSNGSGTLASGSSGQPVVINQYNTYSQAHSRYELYKSKQQTAAAVKLAMMGAG